MARPRTNHDNKKNELIKIAFKLFMTNGYENTSIQDILKAAEISKGAMYHYFTSKEDILDEVLNYLIDCEIRRLDPVINNSNSNSLEKIAALVNFEVSDLSEEVKQANRYIEKSINSIFHYRAKDLSKSRTIPIFAKIIEDGVKSGEFCTHYPYEMACFIYVSGQEIENWFLNNLDKSVYIEQIGLLVNLIEYCLGLKKEQHDFLLKFWTDQINKSL